MKPPSNSFRQSPLFHHMRGQFESPQYIASQSEGQTSCSPVRNLRALVLRSRDNLMYYLFLYIITNNFILF